MPESSESTRPARSPAEAEVLTGPDGDPVTFTDPIVLAVQLNVARGVPMPLADRTLAAARIVRSHAQLSDRAIAAYTGLAAKTVASIRERCSEDGHQVTVRRGRDGRLRPVNAVAGRRAAGKFLAGKPNASLREIARAAGISPNTARDVRDRVRRGEDPVPAHLRAAAGRGKNGSRDEPVRRSAPTRGRALRVLRGDPAVQYTSNGRRLLRLLTMSTPSRHWLELVDTVPEHCRPLVLEAARECARSWQVFVKQLERNELNRPQ